MLAYLVLATFPVALLAGAMIGRYPATARIAALWPALLTVMLSQELFASPPAGGHLVEIAWAPSLGLSLSFHLDGLGLLFALLITAVGTLVGRLRECLSRESPAGGPFLRVALRLHGLDARRRAQRQHPHAICVLGTHRIHFVPAHRLRARPSRRAIGGVAGPDRDRRGWPGACLPPACCSSDISGTASLSMMAKNGAAMAAHPALCRDRRCWSCSPPSPSRRRCHFTSGSRTRWRRRRRSARICTRRPW